MDGGLPLYELDAAPDAWHRVRSPGGYEWWHFDAESAAGLRLTIRFGQGGISNREYLQRYAAYRRHPTRRLPPTPAEYAAVDFGLYEREQAIAQFKAQGEFNASSLTTDVTIGENRVKRDLDGLRISLRHEETSADLVFHPLWPHRPIQRRLCSRELTGADHWWVIADPLCVVKGDIRVGDRAIPVNGRGYHDHHYGSGPLLNVRRWRWGRILREESALAFQMVTPRDSMFSPQSQLIEAGADGVREGEAETMGMDQWQIKLTGRVLDPDLPIYSEME
jgi:carotenoid 1,2-hydratase